MRMHQPIDDDPKRGDIEVHERGTGAGSYAIIVELDGEGNRWLRLEWRSDTIPSEDDSLVCDLSKWR